MGQVNVSSASTTCVSGGSLKFPATNSCQSDRRSTVLCPGENSTQQKNATNPAMASQKAAVTSTAGSHQRGSPAASPGWGLHFSHMFAENTGPPAPRPSAGGKRVSQDQRPGGGEWLTGGDR